MKSSGSNGTAALLSRIRESGRTVIGEHEAKKLLAGYGITVPEGGIAATPEEAVRIAGRLNFPLVLKVHAGEILHKTDIGGVRTGIRSMEELSETFIAMDAAMKGKGIAGYGGILVEEQCPPGVEIIAGITDDPVFGPLLMAGTGGVFTDILGDVTFRMLPVAEDEVRSMLFGLKGWPLLRGFRGAPASDMDSLVKTFMAIGRMGTDASGIISSMDCNPVIAGPGGCVVVDAVITLRETVAGAHQSDWEPRTEHMENFFNPESVAVVGASTTPGKIGNVIVDTLINMEYRGKVYPVNPNYDEIMGMRSYPDIRSLPEAPGLTVIVVDLERTPEILGEMSAIGARNALIVSGGGKELGGDRERLEAGISELARTLGIRVIGPNCIGSFDGHSRFDSFFYHRERFKRPPAGSMSFITQSGTWGCSFMERASSSGVRRMVSYGNRVDVDEGDLIAFLAGDERTSVIGSYIEGLGTGRKFTRAVGLARSKGKPVVVFKTGRTAQAAHASVSHTGAYGGSYRVYHDTLTQAGAILTDSFHECFAACEALSLQPPARGNRVALLSNGAGPMVNALDLFPGKGLELAVLSDASKNSMRERFSFFYIVDNPVDVTGSASSVDYEYVIERLMEDDGVDIIMPFLVFQNTPLDEAIAGRLGTLNEGRKKPIICCATDGDYSGKMSARLKEKGIPVLPDVIQWVTAASALARWGELLREEH